MNLCFRQAVNDIRTYELQPLRIPAGWHITYNMFSEYDPGKDDERDCYALCEDMLTLENRNLLIDLGWYPDGDINGRYELYLVDTSAERPFDPPLEAFCSRSKKEIVDKIEYWTNYGFFSKYLH